MNMSSFVVPVLAVMIFVTSFGSDAYAAKKKKKQKPKPPVTTEELANIEKAVAGLSAVKPAKLRKVLVFNRTDGYYHTSIKCAAKSLELIGKKTGAFETVESEDMAVFDAGNLKQFDAVCFNSTTKLSFQDDDQRKALMDFVKGGKGIVGIHGATDCYQDWPEAAEMIGGTFDSHPWTKKGTWAFKVDEPTNPITNSLDAKGFKLSDEIYRHKPLKLSDRCRVLVSLDMNDEATRSAKSKKGGVLPTDNDVPVSWVRPFGQGRVFYTGFGHNHDIFWNEAILGHILAGIQYAVGDLEIDDSIPQPNTLTEAEIKDGWKLLFDGKTANNFRYAKGKPKWQIKDGVMTVCPDGLRTGSIVFADTYSNFDLKLDFKVTEAANSGIKYLNANGAAFEYQILDDEKHGDARRGIDGNRSLASLYDMIPPKNKMINPVGQWNQARIIVNGKHIEHWLNGIKVLEFDCGSERFNKHFAQSKYKDSKKYGKNTKGGILLQDHSDEVSFRNIKIKELK